MIASCKRNDEYFFKKGERTLLRAVSQYIKREGELAALDIPNYYSKAS